MIDDTKAAAVLFGGTGASPPTPAPAVSPGERDPADVLFGSSPARSMPPTASPEAASQAAPAAALYDAPMGDGVNYSEPVPDRSDLIPVDLPEDVATTTNSTELGQIRKAFVEAGVGLTLGASLVKQAVAAARTPITTTPEQAEAALRQKFGASADAKIQAAREMIAKAAVRWPGIYDHLDRTGLGNSPHLIEQLAARAARRAK